jgi:thiol-disulfide isomerase/thioredoxin
MRQFFIFLIGLSLLAVPVTSQISFSEIEGSQDWELLKQQAKADNKLIFLDIYATWCGPCKYLDSNVYPDKALGEIYNALYVSAKIDGESEYGRQLASAFELQAYPTMYLLSPSEDLLATIVGVREPAALGEIGHIVSKNRDKFLKLSEVTDFNQSSRDELLMYHSLLISADQKDKAGELGGIIVPFLTEEEIFSPDFKELVVNSLVGLNSNVFKAVANNRETALDWFGEESFNQLMAGIFNTTLTEAIASTNEMLVENIIEDFIEVYIGSDPEEIKSAAFITRKLYYANTGNWDTYEKLVMDTYASDYAGESGFLYNEAYALVNDFNSETDALIIADKLTEEAVNISQTFDNFLLAAYIKAMLGESEGVQDYILKMESMNLTDDQKEMLKELSDMVSDF